ncbi:mechanosensitive ion channel protein 1, mitochondrial isoform X1 [Rhodamnia argentea]|uniref:LOW QUALITY PROTEIN: mechanosensitive ion channel protein 1, mitochondrial n=1 Tax=Rhodamnia argentea TaxID=178133 RepID=A0A8B8Q3J2_9MYRT|nr:mechanosensitive ion channel protein 1, mitochondrial isoform X1 [Rhodamnia argentea]XP_048141833.1 mechanosensitive ion channel protein 1, mitochondrial isoform X1 [Rhodamnia argentea]XP_048141834.1 mechanosensitive ion channel protein 1, mitochondrial isoform X1 [Rhodamnia argentea]XP_048141835.1 mechanosensitive ion channel protein 1, mitochondrial isoform X1 [Rhodamnia argentea]
MAKIGFPSLKSICKFTVPCSKWLLCKSGAACSKYPTQVHVRASRPSLDAIHCSKESRSLNYAKTYQRMLAPVSISGTTGYLRKPTNGFSPKLTRTCCGSNFSPFLASPLLDSRSFTSYLGGKRDTSEESEVSAVSGAGEAGDGDNVVVSSEWFDKIKEAWHGTVDVAGRTGEKVKDVSDELTPYVQQVLDSHPYVKNVFMPIGLTLTGTLLAWFVMPRILRRFHKYATQGQAALLSGTPLGEEVPYDKSVWGALEDPLRYLVTFMAFWQITMMVAPTTIASQYIGQAWRGAVILSFVWFLHRWKTNVFSRALAVKSLAGLDREKMLALDRLSSIGLFVIGLMALAEACGVAVQSIITVGGIGGVATAFAAKDILGNVLSGLSMQFSKPFSLGDTIKAGSIEGQVVEMGLTTTSLLNADKFPVIVPNSLFSSQVIVNKSRAGWRAIVTKIPLQSDDLEKIPLISNDIKNMLKSHPKVFLGKEIPYCFLSQVESSHVELTLGCNLKQMGRDELYTTQQDILLQSIQIIKRHGARLGSRMQETTGQ